ncbi:MAG TPA: sugar-binding protein [Pasteurellaceae bacterium]|nr:sugar-binding protein [Pasteurellaceae bacterium]
MIKLTEDVRLVYKCCCLYYIDNKKQEEISKILNISRPTISRLLKQGEILGIVSIRINNPETNRTYEIERKLEETFNLKNAIVVDNENLFTYASNKIIFEFISQVLEGNKLVGVSMGKTLRDLLISLNNTVEHKHSNGYTFIPVVGGVGKNNTEMHSNYLASRFAKVFGGNAIQFFSPAIFSNPAIAKEFAKEEIVKQVTDQYNDLGVIIMGIGSKENSTLLNAGYIDRDILDNFYMNGAVGDICLNFYDIDGEIERFKSFNERVIGIKIDQIKKIKHRVGIALDETKIDAVYGAINGEFINALIIDLNSANKLLAKGN